MVFQRGDILLIRSVLDPQGGNAKNRPCLVINELNSNYICIAITFSYLVNDPLRVELPWASPQYPRSGLHKRCAAACNWFLEVSVQDVIEKISYCPGKTLLKIMQVISTL
jgi:hypothetical protein